jgi:uncharacterized membrane protein
VFLRPWSYCYNKNNVIYNYVIQSLVAYLPLTVILIFTIRILIVAKKQRKRILAETALPVTTSKYGQPANKMSAIRGFFHAVKDVKTFSIVVVVLIFCVLIPNVVGLLIYYSCSESCKQMWYVVFHYEFYGINSIVNAFIYGMRHIKYRKGYQHIILKILGCNKLTKWSRILPHNGQNLTSSLFMALVKIIKNKTIIDWWTTVLWTGLPANGWNSMEHAKLWMITAILK